jgi:methyl-accepting chemotaxis protein
VRQNAEQAQRAAALAGSSGEDAGKGERVVRSAVRAMGEIHDSSTRVAAITGSIDEIAFQTNLLALNAAVEASRAGEHGRGFAVVAAEVRSLAQRTSLAAKEIRGLIRDSVEKIADGTAHVTESGRSLEGIATSVRRMSGMADDIASASREQDAAITQVSQNVSEMDRVTQSAAAETEEMSATANLLASHADRLQSLVGRFQLTATAPLRPAHVPAVPPAHSRDTRRRRAPVRKAS